MTALFERRWVRIAFAATIAAGVVAVTTVDVAVAQQRRAHDRKVAAARALRRAETRYLNDVTKIAADVYAVAQPYQQVLDAFIGDPTTIVAARDAFGVPAPAKQMKALVARLDGLTVPRTMHTHQAKLRTALSGFVTHLTAIRRQAHVTDLQKLYDAIDNGFEADFGGDAISWEYALQDTFAAHKDAPPKYPVEDETAPTTLVTWVYRADGTCTRSFNQAGPALDRLDKGTETPTDFGLIGRSLRGFTAAMRKVTLPADDQAALRRDIIARLPVVDASARALDAFTHGLESHNSTKIQSALRSIFAAGTAVKPLVTAFHVQGVVICQNLLAELVQINQPSKGSPSLPT
jgi:hypothetical protein